MYCIILVYCASLQYCSQGFREGSTDYQEYMPAATVPGIGAWGPEEI